MNKKHSLDDAHLFMINSLQSSWKPTLTSFQSMVDQESQKILKLKQK